MKAVRDYARTHLATEAVVISAQIESDLIDLSDGGSEGISEGTRRGRAAASARSSARVYHLLGLRTYFTTGEKETRAWTIHAGDNAPTAAGVIHSDFERGFIKAETVHLRRSGRTRLLRQGARSRQAPHGRQGIRREGRRRAGVPVQRLRILTAEALRRRDETERLSGRFKIRKRREGISGRRGASRFRLSCVRGESGAGKIQGGLPQRPLRLSDHLHLCGVLAALIS